MVSHVVRSGYCRLCLHGQDLAVLFSSFARSYHDPFETRLLDSHLTFGVRASNRSMCHTRTLRGHLIRCLNGVSEKSDKRSTTICMLTIYSVGWRLTSYSCAMRSSFLILSKVVIGKEFSKVMALPHTVIPFDARRLTAPSCQYTNCYPIGKSEKPHVDRQGARFL